MNAIGRYEGERPIMSNVPIILDIQADGAWTVQIAPMVGSGTPAFSGKGDAVSDVFEPPKLGPWEIAHNGKSNFIVSVHCSGGRDTIQNEIGPVSGSRVIRFPKGPCFWEVQEDGSWSLKPRSQ